MKSIEKYLESNEIETDELGRIIISDINILDNLNGAISADQNYFDQNLGSVNINCVC